MIQQILNRNFMLGCLADVCNYMELVASSGERRGTETDLSKLTEGERRELFSEFLTAQKDESATSSGQKGYYSERQKRGGSVPPMDDVCFVSRSPAMSNLQSAVEQYFEAQQRVEAVTPSTRRGGLGELPVTERRLFGSFEPADIRWISALAAMGIRKFRHRYPFPKRPEDEKPLRVSNNARFILVGDWGSGLPRAQQVSTQIAAVLAEGKKSQLEQHVIHLGDVYYAGWQYEYEKRFLGCWPVLQSDASLVGSWTLNGNHDMYSGGHDFFQVALTDRRFKAWQRGYSYFAIENDNWRILALDTAYDDFDLTPLQLNWAQRQVATAGPRKLMLLTHHQPFSAYEKDIGNLANRITPLLDTKKVSAWFWGHEHRCVLYREYKNLPFGRCIGHGGVPVYMLHDKDSPVPDPGTWEFRDVVPGIEPWALFGFAVLDFKDRSIKVRYIDETGRAYKNEQLSQELELR